MFIFLWRHRFYVTLMSTFISVVCKRATLKCVPRGSIFTLLFFSNKLPTRYSENESTFRIIKSECSKLPYTHKCLFVRNPTALPRLHFCMGCKICLEQYNKTENINTFWLWRFDGLIPGTSCPLSKTSLIVN